MKIVDPIFRASSEFHCRGFFTTAAAAVQNIPHLDVQILLVEMSLPDVCGLRCARELLAQRPQLKTVITTSLRDAMLIRFALTAGISNWLVKPLRVGQCLATLRLNAGTDDGKPLTLLPGTGQKGQASRPARLLLTTREEQVMAGLAEGLLYKEVADRLQLSHAAVKRLQHHAFLKLQAHNRTEAVNSWREKCCF